MAGKKDNRIQLALSQVDEDKLKEISSKRWQEESVSGMIISEIVKTLEEAEAKITEAVEDEDSMFDLKEKYMTGIDIVLGNQEHLSPVKSKQVRFEDVITNIFAPNVIDKLILTYLIKENEVDVIIDKKVKRVNRTIQNLYVHQKLKDKYEEISTITGREKTMIMNDIVEQFIRYNDPVK